MRNDRFDNFNRQRDIPTRGERGLRHSGIVLVFGFRPVKDRKMRMLGLVRLEFPPEALSLRGFFDRDHLRLRVGQAASLNASRRLRH